VHCEFPWRHSTLRVPKNNLTIVPGSRQHGAVGRKRGSANPVNMFAQAVDQLARDSVPDSNAVIITHGGQELPPRLHADGAHHRRLGMMRVFGQVKDSSFGFAESGRGPQHSQGQGDREKAPAVQEQIFHANFSREVIAEPPLDDTSRLTATQRGARFACQSSSLQDSRSPLGRG
jgi:hypothetical protein